MTGERLRPTFEIPAEAEPGVLTAHLKRTLDAEDAHLESQWSADATHVRVAPTRERRRFYSAWLDLELRPSNDGDRTTVVGRFAPNPRLWTAYVLTLISLVAVGLIALVLTILLILEQRDAWGWWWVQVAAVAIAAALFFGTLWAQRKASREMDELRAVIEQTLGRKANRADDATAHEHRRKAG